jgi:hypothetical protein
VIPNGQQPAKENPIVRKQEKTKVNSRIVSLPGRAGGNVVVSASFAQSTILLAYGGKSTSLATLVNWVADPVDACITTDL